MMTTFHKKFVRRGAMFVAAMLLFTGLAVEPAVACWNTLLIECFDANPNTWPWTQHPPGSGRQWRCSPTRSPGGPDTWGIQEIVYSTHLQFLCSDDHQSAWCIGGPGTHDPDFDFYQANLNTYMTYGAINLTNAVDARVQFSYYLENADDTGDSLFWGADSVFGLAPAHIWYDSAANHNSIGGWNSYTMDLKDLRRQNGDSVSALGRPVVYIYWWFKANSNPIRDRGAFIDDVIVQWDDGFLDLTATNINTLNPVDSTLADNPVIIGDSLFASISWTTCDGSYTELPAYRVTLQHDATVLIDTLIEGSPPDHTYQLFSPMWHVETEGDHNLLLTVDAMAEISESNENNNTMMDTYSAIPPNIPPTFVWITPDASDTLSVQNNVMLRWEAFDADGEATYSIYYDQDPEGCFGPSVPGAQDLTEMDGPDSVSWSVTLFPNNTVFWPFAVIYDQEDDTCVYAPNPVVIDRTSGVDDNVNIIPDAFFLNQNYPNPFNPETEISFGIRTPGHVSLRVYDLLGREAAVVVNEAMSPGTYQRAFSGHDLPSGVYVYTLSAPEGTQSRKMILMK